MRARIRLAATTLGTVALLGGTVACTGEAPGRDQVERDVAEDFEEGEDEEGEG